jgi:uncharacterized protein (TIGR02145 family)
MIRLFATVAFAVLALFLLCPSAALAGTVSDYDGNVYQTVVIGNQEWMAENLKVTHYSNGDAIPNVTDNSAWAGLGTGAYCEYNNDISYVNTYGRSYNWYAVYDSRGLAPTGWRVPTDIDWQSLVDYLGGAAVAGGKMKESGTAHWVSPNLGATNECGFTGLPGTYRNGSGEYKDLGQYAYYWSSTGYNSDCAWDRQLSYIHTEVTRHNSSLKVGGFRFAW